MYEPPTRLRGSETPSVARTSKPREKLARVAIEQPGALVRIQHVRREERLEVRAHSAHGTEWEVGAEEQFAAPHQVEQRLDVARKREPCTDLVVQSAEPAEDVDSAGGLPAKGQNFRHARDPVGEHGKRRPRVRNDDLQAGEALDGPAQDQVGDRAGGVEEELEHRTRVAEGRCREARRGGRMDEDPCFAPVELRHDGLEALVPEIDVAEVGEQDDAVGVERVEGVGDLAPRGLHIGQRERREETESLRMRAHDRCARLVDTASPGRRVCAEGHPWRGDGEHRRLDAEGVHHRQVAVGVPCGDEWPSVGRGVSVVEKRLTVVGR